MLPLKFGKPSPQERVQKEVFRIKEKPKFLRFDKYYKNCINGKTIVTLWCLNRFIGKSGL